MSSNVDLEIMSVDERLALIEEIRDSLDPADVPIEPQRAELDRRLDDLGRDPELGITWEDVLRRIRNRTR